MPLFASRAFFGMTAIALSCAALSGCVPSNAAVGDTQSPNTAVAHSTEDRDSLSIAMIGSDDVTADSMAMEAMEAGKLKPVYITVSGTVDAQSTAQQGVRDMAQRKADLIIIAGIDANEANAENSGRSSGASQSYRRAERQQTVCGYHDGQRSYDRRDTARRCCCGRGQ